MRTLIQYAKIGFLTLLMTVLNNTVGNSISELHSTEDANFLKTQKLLENANAAFQSLNAYSADIICNERINGKRHETEYISSEFMKPNNIYLKWNSGRFTGMELSHVPKRDGKNHFVSKGTGIPFFNGVCKWNCDSKLINTLSPHHFTVPNTSIKFFIDISGELLSKALKLNKLHISEIKEVYNQTLKTETIMVKVSLSDNPADGLRWPRLSLYFDKKTDLPLHFILYDFDGGLYGEYAFTNFKASNEICINDFKL